jgi:hypothetical protein
MTSIQIGKLHLFESSGIECQKGIEGIWHREPLPSHATSENGCSIEGIGHRMPERLPL